MMVRPDVRGHDDDGILEIHRAALVVGQAAVVKHLQQDVEHIRVGFFDLVQQYHGIGLSPDRFGQLPALFISHVARGRSDQPRNGMPFLVFRHIDPHHAVLVVEEEFCQGFCQFGLSHTGRPEEDERPDRAFRVLQPGTAPADCIGNCPDGFILAHDTLVEFGLEAQQFLFLALQHPAHGNAGPARDHFGNLLCIHLLVHHRGVLLQHGQFFFEFLHGLFSLRDTAIADLCHLPEVAFAFGTFGLEFQVLDLSFPRLDLFNQVFLRLPLCLQPVPFLGQVRDLLVQALQFSLVFLPLDGFPFNLQLADLAFNRSPVLPVSS